MDNTVLQLILKIFTSCVCGFIIGIEREKEHKPAGLRTCMLVSFCMTMLMILNEELIKFFGGNDVLRLPAYCILSVGFLGSGIIHCYRQHIEGVTTACIMLILVAIGLLCGIEKYVLACISTVVTYGILKLKHIEQYFRKKNEK